MLQKGVVFFYKSRYIGYKKGYILGHSYKKGAGRAFLCVWRVEPRRSGYSGALLQYKRNFGCGGWTRMNSE